MYAIKIAPVQEKILQRLKERVSSSQFNSVEPVVCLISAGELELRENLFVYGSLFIGFNADGVDAIITQFALKNKDRLRQMIVDSYPSQVQGEVKVLLAQIAPEDLRFTGIGFKWKVGKIWYTFSFSEEGSAMFVRQFNEVARYGEV